MADRAPPEPVAEDPLEPRLVAVAYLLAAVCLILPLAVVGAIFAGIVVRNRGQRGHGIAVIALSIACAVIGIALLR